MVEVTFCALFVLILVGAIVPPMIIKVDFLSWLIVYAIVVSVAYAFVKEAYQDYLKEHASMQSTVLPSNR